MNVNCKIRNFNVKFKTLTRIQKIYQGFTFTHLEIIKIFVKWIICWFSLFWRIFSLSPDFPVNFENWNRNNVTLCFDEFYQPTFSKVFRWIFLRNSIPRWFHEKFQFCFCLKIQFKLGVKINNGEMAQHFSVLGVQIHNCKKDLENSWTTHLVEFLRIE